MARFLPLTCLYFVVWLVSRRFVLLPAPWLVLGACLPYAACSRWVCSFRAVWCLYLLCGWFWVACLSVVGGLARSRAVFCLRLPSWLGFGSPRLPVLCGVAGSVPFRACTCFVARFCRLLACCFAAWLALSRVNGKEERRRKRKRRGEERMGEDVCQYRVRLGSN